MTFVEETDLEAAFLYLDNITICGKDQKENGVNLEHFLEDSKRKNICYNTDKCISPPGASLSLDMSSRMEYHLPAPDRLRPLHELPVPHDSTSVNRSLGLLSYYSNGFQNSQIESGLLLDANLSH